MGKSEISKWIAQTQHRSVYFRIRAFRFVSGFELRISNFKAPLQ